MQVKINHLQHVGMPVTDLAISKEFYESLGFEDVMQTTFLHDGGTGNVAMMKLGDIMVELYQMPASALREVRNRKDGRIDHIAFDVDDIDATYALVKSEGFNVVEDEPVFLNFWEKGCKYFNILGPGGERLEFCQVL